MSDDEFDNIPDEFADIEGIDWTTLLAGPSTSRPPPAGINEQGSSLPGAASSSRQIIYTCDNEIVNVSSSPPDPNDRSSSYFSEGNEINASFLAELDRVEQRALEVAGTSSVAQPTRLSAFGVPPPVESGTGNPSVVTVLSIPLPNEDEVRSSRHFSRTEPAKNATLPSKRSRPSDEISQTRKGKMKANVELQDILSTYEDELNCPICCDLLVAAHVGNPCGHTFCGECGWQWHVENKNQGCPCCRRLLDKSTPMIPNIAMDNAVDKHVNALALCGATEWEPSGRKHRDWTTRKDTWRAGASKRERKKARVELRAQSSVPIPVFEVFDPPPNWLHGEHNVEGAQTYEDSDTELIPRPIRRARRRRRTGLSIIDMR